MNRHELLLQHAVRYAIALWLARLDDEIEQRGVRMLEQGLLRPTP